METESVFSLHVDAPDSGKRLDVFVAEKVDRLSRTSATQLIKSGYVTVDSRLKKPGYLLKCGDHIFGAIPKAEAGDFVPEPIQLSVLFEDDDIIVIDKPPGMVVHPAPGHSSGTLVNALLYHCPHLPGISGEIRPGIVHRLDKDTSGILVVAKSESALRDLSEQFKHRKVQKEYIALVIGDPKTECATIELPIGRHPVNRKKMSVVSRKSRSAKTEWRLLERLNGYSLLRLHIKTGRTHQIRVHCAAMGHPILGDPVYGRQRAPKGTAAEKAAVIKSVKRQMLHAGRLSFRHPQTKSAMSFAAEIPPDMAEIIHRLRAARQ
ncbi:MAG: RluA family pseudouridine synthase [Desulfobacterales bacterium]